MSAKPETLFRKRVLPKIKAIKPSWICTISQRSKVGTPDILMNLGGVFVAIELKSEGGKASKLQEYNLTEIAASGGIAIILEPANEEEVLDFLSTVASIGVVGKNEVLRRDS